MYSRLSNKRRVWNKYIGWKFGIRKINVWYGIIVLGRKKSQKSISIQDEKFLDNANFESAIISKKDNDLKSQTFLIGGIKYMPKNSASLTFLLTSQTLLTTLQT